MGLQIPACFRLLHENLLECVENLVTQTCWSVVPKYLFFSFFFSFSLIFQLYRAFTEYLVFLPVYYKLTKTSCLFCKTLWWQHIAFYVWENFLILFKYISSLFVCFNLPYVSPLCVYTAPFGFPFTHPNAIKIFNF